MLDSTRIHNTIGEAIADAITRSEQRTVVYEDFETGRFGWATWHEMLSQDSWYYTINPMAWVWDSELGNVTDAANTERMAKEKATAAN